MFKLEEEFKEPARIHTFSEEGIIKINEHDNLYY